MNLYRKVEGTGSQGTQSDNARIRSHVSKVNKGTTRLQITLEELEPCKSASDGR